MTKTPLSIGDRLNRVRYKVAVAEAAITDDGIQDAPDAMAGLGFLFQEIKSELEAIEDAIRPSSKEDAP